MVRRRGMLVVATTLFGVAIVTMTVVLLVQGKRHDDVMLRYRASQALTTMIDRYVQTGGTRDLDGVVPYVVGFGVFDTAGTFHFGVGSIDAESFSDPETASGIRGWIPETDTDRPGTKAFSGSEIAIRKGEVVRVIRRSGAGLGGGLTQEVINNTATGRGRGRTGGGPLLWMADYTTDSVLAERRIRILFVSFLVGSIGTLATVTFLLGRSIRRVEERARRNESLAQLGAAARTITHEIKNPLASIRLQTSLLRRIASRDTAVQPVLETIDEEVRRIAELTEEVRSFLHDPKGTPSVIDAGAAIRELIPRQPFPITLIESDDVAYIYIDRLRFHSIVTNLLLNAHQAMSEPLLDTEATEGGTPPVIVVIEVERSGSDGEAGEVRVVVTDSGPGIPKSIRPSIFDPFFTTREDGTGIGLANVYTFVTAARGTIEIGDAPQSGAEVTIRFPYTPERPR